MGPAVQEQGVGLETAQCLPGHADPQLEGQPHRAQGPLASACCSHTRGWGVFPQVAALGDEDEDEDDFVEVPEKEGYEACVPDYLWPEAGEWRGRGTGRRAPLRQCSLGMGPVAHWSGSLLWSGPGGPEAAVAAGGAAAAPTGLVTSCAPRPPRGFLSLVPGGAATCPYSAEPRGPCADLPARERKVSPWG